MNRWRRFLHPLFLLGAAGVTGCTNPLPSQPEMPVEKIEAFKLDVKDGTLDDYGFLTYTGTIPMPGVKVDFVFTQWDGNTILKTEHWGSWNPGEKKKFEIEGKWRKVKQVMMTSLALGDGKKLEGKKSWSWEKPAD